VEISGKLAPAGATRALTNEDTRRIGSDLIGSNQEAIDNLKQTRFLRRVYSLPGAHRFRVNVFMQRGSCAIVMRVIPSKIPDFATLNLPDELGKICGAAQRNRAGDGPDRVRQIVHPGGYHRTKLIKSSLSLLPIEDPIEFLHPTKTALSIKGNCTAIRRALPLP